MKSRKALAVMLSLVFVFLSIPLQTSAIEGEHIFTYEELACMEYVPAEECILDVADSLIPINNIENSSKGTTTYYIIECADGYMLTNPSGTTFSRTRYNSGSLQYKKWNFTEDSNGNLIVYSYSNPTKCLTVNPTTKTVSLSTYSSSSNYQKWKMYYSSGGNALKCVSSDSSVNGYLLVINGSNLSVSNTTYTKLGFFDVSWYTPVTALSYSNFYLAPEQSRYVYPTKTPSGATTSNRWINWATNTNDKATVDNAGKVSAVAFGTTYLYFTDKITRVYGMCSVFVTRLANGTYFLKNKENSQYAKVKAGTMANGLNVVQYDLDGDSRERWIFTLNNDTGYYSVKSVASTSATSYYMAVTNDTSNNNETIVIRSATESTLTDGMKWSVSKTTSGAYKLTPKCASAYSRVLCTSTSSSSNNNNLVQKTYADDSSYIDEWIPLKPESSECGIFMPFKAPTRTFSIQCIGSNATGTIWLPLIQESAAAWNGTTAGTNISVSTNTSSYTCEVDTYSDLWYGLTTPLSISGNQLNEASIKINSRTCSSSTNWRKSTITHEIGHLLGLLDNPPTSSDNSLMNHGRNRNNIYTPQEYDIMNVKYIYSV